jgi:hypothetical protein
MIVWQHKASKKPNQLIRLLNYFFDSEQSPTIS